MAHFINQPIAWNHVVRGEAEFWTHKRWSVIKNNDGTYDVLVDGSTLHSGDTSSSDALRRAGVLIRNPVGL